METLLFHFSIIKLLSYWLATCLVPQVRTSDCKGAKVQPLNSTSQCVQCILGQYAKAFIGKKVLWTYTHWSEFSSPHLRCFTRYIQCSSKINEPKYTSKTRLIWYAYMYMYSRMSHLYVWASLLLQCSTPYHGHPTNFHLDNLPVNTSTQQSMQWC